MLLKLLQLRFLQFLKSESEVSQTKLTSMKPVEFYQSGKYYKHISNYNDSMALAGGSVMFGRGLFYSGLWVGIDQSQGPNADHSGQSTTINQQIK
jgi:hypothetical protein